MRKLLFIGAGLAMLGATWMLEAAPPAEARGACTEHEQEHYVVTPSGRVNTGGSGHSNGCITTTVTTITVTV
jgi:hypothetical protein